MSWGTSFNKDIYLERKEYAGIGHVEEELHDIEDSIDECRSEIKMFAAANLKDLKNENCDNVISWLNIDINNVLERYEDLLKQRIDLKYYLEYLKEKQRKNPELNKFIKLKIINKFFMIGRRTILLRW